MTTNQPNQPNRPEPSRPGPSQAGPNQPEPSQSESGASQPTQAPRYVMPTSSLGRKVNGMFNGTVAALTRRGFSVWGSRVLCVRGRTSGEWRTNPVNVLTHDGSRYLVAPRGQTQWVRNLRVAGGGELRVCKKVEKFVATELSDERKPEILRAYLKRWKMEVGVFFDGVNADAPDAKLLEIASGYPVFQVRHAE